MLYKDINLFKTIDRLVIPASGIDNKNIALLFFPENTTFIESFQFMNINPRYIKHVFIPVTKIPFNTRLEGGYRKILQDFKLIPFQNVIGGDYSELLGKNFYIDTSTILGKVSEKWSLEKYNSGKSLNFINSIVNWLGGFPQTQFERVLLYVVNLNSLVPPKILNRRIFPVYDMIYNYSLGKVELPFDKLLMYFYDHTGGRWVLLFDRNKKPNLARMKKIIQLVKDDNEDKQADYEINQIADKSIRNTPIDDESTPQQKNIIRKSIVNYIKSTGDRSGIKGDVLLNKSLMYHKVGDLIKTVALARNMANTDNDSKIKEIKKIIPITITKEPIRMSIKNPAVSFAKPDELNDGINPKHILNLRKREFSENLINDVRDAFNTLNKEKIPLRVHSIKSKIVESGPDELSKTVKQLVSIDLIDDKDTIHEVELELPYMNPDGAFTMNGIDKVLITQLVMYPIFFIKPYAGRFQSSYSTFTIHSKHLTKSSYLMIYIGGYKFPLSLLLGYKLGFSKMLKLFNIEGYSIVENNGDIKLPDGKYIKFKGSLNEVQTQLIDSISRSVKYFPRAEVDLENPEYWKETLISTLGNRSSLYYIDNMWDNIITPIEKKILDSRGDPTTIDKVIKYISEEVVTGRIDDRNDVSKLRMRLSELFTAQLQKQIKAAHSEYSAKRLGGDENAKFFMKPTKVLSEISQSQNLQTYENINPIEEISMLMRITPVGIGGPTQDTYPEKARNIHYSYYGNIDPLETPTGAAIGVQQHLTLGAEITNSRGLFVTKDRSKLKSVEMLGTTASLIPFVERNEGARIAMATLQAKQAFPLESPENPAVQTGFESILAPLLSSNFIKKSPVDGTIDDITETYISVIDDKNKKYTIPITSRTLRSGQGKHGLSIFKPVVKIGQKVKRNDFIAEGSNIKDGMISNGINLLCAFMPWKGFNFEDGMVISESAAKKFVSLHTEEISVLIGENEDIAYIVNEGDILKKGDILVSFSSTVYDVETFNNKRSGNGGEIVRIEIYSNKRKLEETTSEKYLDHIPEKLRPIYTNFVRNYIRINGKYPEGHFKDNRESFKGILIKFVIKQLLNTIVGDKIQNRIYNKGVISLTVPDKDMPETPWGERIELIYNPVSIINRMNPGQLFELSTGLISRKLSILIGQIPRNKFQSLLSKVIELLDTSNDKKYLKNLITKVKSLSDSAYKSFSIKMSEDRFFPIIIPPFKSPSKERLEAALSVLGMKTKYPLYLPEFNKKTGPVSIGYMYVFKLEHIGEKKIHSRGVGPYVAGTSAPTAGKSRGGAAFCGEYDFYSLLSYDADIIIDEFYGPLSADHQTKNEMISDIIRSGETTFKKPKTNPTKDMFVQMMNSIHLTSN